MKEWKYLIGSADDFIGAPDWATLRTRGDSGTLYFVERHEDGCRALSADGHISKIGNHQPVNEWPEIIAQRTESFGNAIDLEFCKANPDHPDCKCKEESKVAIGPLEYKITIDDLGLSQAVGDAVAANYYNKRAAYLASKTKYNRPCKGITIDVYDVLQTFAVTNPATQHAIKKLLCAGLRGHKDKMQDLTEALKSIERAIELEKE